MNPRIGFEIKQFVLKQETNKDGQTYRTVEEKDAVFVEQFLIKFYKAFVSLFSNKRFANEIFIERLLRIDAIRFDDADKDLMPIKLSYEEMNKNVRNKLEGGLFSATMEDGVVLLDMDFMTLSKQEAFHTFIHELVHAMTLIIVEDNGKKYYQTGVQKKYDSVSRNINEGMAEYIAQIIWSKMYPRIKYPGIGRYKLQVDCVKNLLSQLENENEFIEEYIVNGQKINELFESTTNSLGLNVYEYLEKVVNSRFKNKNYQQDILKAMLEFKLDLNSVLID